MNNDPTNVASTLIQELRERMKQKDVNDCYDWFCEQVKQHNLSSAQAFRIVFYSGMPEKEIQAIPWLAKKSEEPTPGCNKKDNKLAVAMEAHLKARRGAKQDTPNPSKNCLDDAKKLCGVAPYNVGGNILVGDGYFANDCRKKYGERTFNYACKMVRGEA